MTRKIYIRISLKRGKWNVLINNEYHYQFLGLVPINHVVKSIYENIEKFPNVY